jgi:uncharacterized protein YqjF (DUF2071 family)
VSLARAQRRSLDAVAHRPWPLPDGRWIMAQSWLDLLFCHWPVDPVAVRPHVPASLPLDLFDGGAWVSIAAFETRATRPRGLPPPPVLSRFPELNVRTYVTLDDRPGIWFFSLDAASRLAVEVARRLYRLPYFRARMSIGADGPRVHCHSERRDRRGPAARFEAAYRATGSPRRAAPGSLEAWLVERYRLYTVDGRGRVLHGDIHHAPWTLHDADADIGADTTTAALGIERRDTPVLQVVARQDVVFWPLRPRGDGRRRARPRRS